MFNIIFFMLIPFRAIFQQNGSHIEFLFTTGGSETYIDGFLDLEYPIFDPKHGFLSSVEAEIISFCQRRQPFAFSAFYVHPLTFEGSSPSIFDK